VILEFVKSQCHLSAPFPLAVLLAVAAVWAWRRPGSLGARRYVAAVAAGYWFVTTPIGAAVLVSGLSYGVTRVMTREDAKNAPAVVLLGGGAFTVKVDSEVASVPTASTLIRTLEAVRVFRISGAQLLVASGGIAQPERQARPESEIMRELLVRSGVAPAAIVEDAQSRTTRQQAQVVTSLLRSRGIERAVLVTSPTHIRRSLAVFRAAGLDPIPAATPIRSELGDPAPFFLPNSESLSQSDEALYEYAALVYYWLGGWMRSSADPKSGSQ
jgi:uncharacterized SAM-binding protein YcdF (DUF218 family)